MSRRAAASLAWSVWAVCVVLLALTALLDYYLTPPFPNMGNANVYQFFGVPVLVYASVGAFVASRRPKNLVGWLLCLIGFVCVVQGFSVAYADYTLLADSVFSLPGGMVMACISQSLVALPILMSLATLLILLFPDGSLPDRSVRAVPWIVVGGSAMSALWAVTAERGFDRYSMRNPLHVGGVVEYIVKAFGGLGVAAVLVGLVVAIVVVFDRLGNARGAERQQLKWFAYAAGVLLMILFLAPFVEWYLPGWFSFPLGVAVFAALPVAVGIAVLKYRLYDIDHIINRTLVYGLLTILLAAGYFAAIMALEGIGNLVFQVPFRAAFGQESTLATVAATLAMAALFNPLRRRIQSFIDRSFYRNKYDAAKTLEAFSMKLRNETDLDALSDDLVAVVRETMQPAHVSLWLRPDPALKDKKKRAAIREAGRDEQ
jgi:hypothetical protein